MSSQSPGSVIVAIIILGLDIIDVGATLIIDGALAETIARTPGYFHPARASCKVWRV